MESDVKSLYEKNLEELRNQHAEVALKCRRGSAARGITFLISAAVFFYVYAQAGAGTLLHWGGFAVSVLVFLAVVIVHNIFEVKEKYLRVRINFYQQSIARMDRDWEKITNEADWFSSGESEKAKDLFPEDQESDEESARRKELTVPLVNDLDLEGEKSLWKLVNLCQSEMGKEYLSRWMLRPADQNTIQSRQDAARSIAKQHQWRTDLLLLVNEMAEEKSDPSSVVRWSLHTNKPTWFGALLWSARILALASIVSILLVISGLIPFNTFCVAMFCIFIVNFLITVCTAGYASETFRKIGSSEKEVVRYRKMMEHIAECPSETKFVQDRNATLTGQHKSSPDFLAGMKSLVGISNLTSIRRGVGFPLYVILQYGLLWDVHLMDALWKWKSKWGKHVPDWFSATGQMEAITALAQFAYEHPHWTFPEITAPKQNSPDILAQVAGHPILGPQSICNPMNVGPSDQTILVTGSNMSGKSTFLRALGVNLILGKMGTKVYAESFRMPPVDIGTSMRVSDSLSDGISFFMSELRRLKQIVDAAQSTQNDLQFIYLLDEILQGTNSQERQIAVAKVVSRLQKAGAVGALSTHDLQLPDVKELAGHLQVVHFKESFVEKDGKKEMTFDYILRQGLSPSTNALKLLALVGLDDPS